MAPLILASSSPRRREFMRALGLPFVIHVADVDERNGEGEPPDALVARLSREKAQAVAVRYPYATVIGADTIVTLDGQLLGKPAGPEDATAMLRALRDRPHEVYSGVTLCPPEPRGAEPRTVVVDSTVWMRPYGDDEIAAYVGSGDPLDKAGAYAIQNVAFHPVARMRGCYASVMGLPLCALARLLGQVGIATPTPATKVCASLTGVACCGGEPEVFVLEVV
jgi:septum formation protein